MHACMHGNYKFSEKKSIANQTYGCRCIAIRGTSYCNSNHVNSEIASLNFVKMIPTEEMDKITMIIIIIVCSRPTIYIYIYVRKFLYNLFNSCCNIDKPDQRLVWSHEGSCRSINIAPRLYKSIAYLTTLYLEATL